jgi:hypothetical protein
MMYGLKPVPFKLEPEPFKLKPVPFKLGRYDKAACPVAL